MGLRLSPFSWRRSPVKAPIPTEEKTIQNAADLEFPATDPANAPARSEFKLGILPPDHHVAPATPVPTPAPATTPKP